MSTNEGQPIAAASGPTSLHDASSSIGRRLTSWPRRIWAGAAALPAVATPGQPPLDAALDEPTEEPPARRPEPYTPDPLLRYLEDSLTAAASIAMGEEHPSRTSLSES